MHFDAMRMDIAVGVLGTAGAILLAAGNARGGETPSLPGGATSTNSPDQKFTFHFRAASVDTVLEHFATAGRFIINKEDSPSGSLDLNADGAVSRAEAVQLLNTALQKNGYIALAKGRILTIRKLDTAKTADLDVLAGSDPEAVERSDEMVTQVIPVRFASCTQLVNNLQPLLPLSATLSANESANSLLLVAMKKDVRRMLRIVTLLDNSIATVSSLKVFALRFADAKQLVAVCQQLFAQSQSSQSQGGSRQGQPDFNFAGGPPGMPGGPGANSGPSSSSQSGSTGARNPRIVAAADETSNSLIVCAPPDSLLVVSNMVHQLDRQADSLTDIRVFQLKNADATEIADQLATLFPDNSSSSTRDNSPMQFGGGPPGPMGGGPMGPMGFGAGAFGPPGGGGSGDTTSSRASKKARVIAVPDQRSSSLTVSADTTVMPHISRLIQELDANPARKEVVQVFDLQNAAPNEITQVLQDLFNRNSSVRNNSANQQNLNSDPLLTRETQQQQTGTQGTSGFGNFGGGSGLGGSGGSTQSGGR